MDKMIENTKELMEEQMPSFDFLLDEEAERNSLLAEHRAWLKSIKHERPLPKHPFHVAVYIRYFNQTRYENYLGRFSCSANHCGYGRPTASSRFSSITDNPCCLQSLSDIARISV